MQVDFEKIRESVKLASGRDRVWQALTTPNGLAAWWAERAEIEPMDGGILRLHFSNRRILDSKVIMCRAPEYLAFVYFGGTRAAFELATNPAGGTIVTVTDSGFSSQQDYAETLAGWVSVLLALKAQVDFGVDLRNHNPVFSWEHGFADN
ncbi:MAG TPA: SRPBCC domain-containing protein [Ktedonobacterales bacterium]|jgi:uncharacterized protein YndB with AHSA1/START domain